MAFMFEVTRVDTFPGVRVRVGVLDGRLLDGTLMLDSNAANSCMTVGGFRMTGMRWVPVCIGTMKVLTA